MADVVGRARGRGGGGGGRGRGGGGGAGREGGWGQGGGGRAGAGGKGRGSGRGGPDVDPLLDNPYLAFEDESEAFHICEKFRRMEIVGHAAVDWTTLEEVAEVARARDYIEHDTLWDGYTLCYCVFFVLYKEWILTTLCDRLFQLAHLSSYWVMVRVFLALFKFASRLAYQPDELDDPDDPWVDVSFRLRIQCHTPTDDGNIRAWQ
ncbi:hypothetical protein Hanom_Chr14g01254611 [Helianthus anomalus]